MSQQSLPPSSEEEWRTHVLNIHGTPFEHLCHDLLQESPDWTVRSSRYPVEYPPSFIADMALQTKNSELDLWGTTTRQDFGIKIDLLVECKKNNPEYTDWVFFHPRTDLCPLIQTIQFYEPRMHFRSGGVLPPSGLWSFRRKPLPLETNIITTDDGREIKEEYQIKWLEAAQKKQHSLAKNLMKTSNTAITDAAYQIALATQAILFQETTNWNDQQKRDPQPLRLPWRQVFLPVIVTTARLHTCYFSSTAVDVKTGNVSPDQVQYQEHPYLFFTYALPPALQYQPDDSRAKYRSDGDREQLARFPILVVQSAKFSDLLTYLTQLTKNDDERLMLPKFS
jgi:hypothetical protein